MVMAPQRKGLYNKTARTKNRWAVTWCGKRDGRRIATPPAAGPQWRDKEKPPGGGFF
jgi:hypothetical protein